MAACSSRKPPRPNCKVVLRSSPASKMEKAAPCGVRRGQQAARSGHDPQHAAIVQQRSGPNTAPPRQAALFHRIAQVMSVHTNTAAR